MLQEESKRSQDTGDKGDIEIGKVMARFKVINCTIIIEGVESKKDALNTLQEMVDSFEEMNDTEASVVLCNEDWKNNIKKI